jgi:hypothetical protein
VLVFGVMVWCDGVFCWVCVVVCCVVLCVISGEGECEDEVEGVDLSGTKRFRDKKRHKTRRSEKFGEWVHALLEKQRHPQRHTTNNRNTRNNTIQRVSAYFSSSSTISR